MIRQKTLSTTISAIALFTSVNPSTFAQTQTTNSLEEIIVTAQRRSESLQDTALAISAVGGERMRSQGVTNLADAVQSTPSVELWSSNLGGGFTIRGVGTRIPDVDSPTSTYSDGVFQSRAEVTNFAFVDVNRIEVLRGPQGTLYGRNAMAGAVNIITNNPTTEAFEASLNVQAGNYSSHHVEAVVNAPLGENAAARLVAVKDYHDGYLSNDLDDADSQAMRLKLLFEPSETITLLAGVEYFENQGKGNGNVFLPLDSRNNAWQAPEYNELSFAGFPVCGGSAAMECIPEQDTENLNAFLQADIDLSWATLTLMPAYQDYESSYWQVFSGLYEYSKRPLEQRSMEVRLTSNEESAISWVTGVYWMEDDTSGLTVQNYSFNTYEYDATNTNKTAAVFGQATIPISDDVNVTAGIRYTEDEFDKSITSSDGAGGFYTLDAAAKFDKVTWKIGIDYKLTESSLAYANLSTGYRQGGTDQSANTFEVFTYEPETLTSLEIGYKARALNDKLQYNVSAFYYQWEEYQASYPVQLEGGFYETRTANVPGTTDIAGIELESAWLVTDNDRIDLSLTYNYSSFADAQLYLNGTQDFFGNPLPAVDLNGIELPNAPKYTAGLTYARDWIMGDLGSVATEISAKYNDGYYVDLLRFTYSEQENYVLYDASIKYFSPSNQWSLSLFGKKPHR